MGTQTTPDPGPVRVSLVLTITPRDGTYGTYVTFPPLLPSPGGGGRKPLSTIWVQACFSRNGMALGRVSVWAGVARSQRCDWSVLALKCLVTHPHAAHFTKDECGSDSLSLLLTHSLALFLFHSSYLIFPLGLSIPPSLLPLLVIQTNRVRAQNSHYSGWEPVELLLSVPTVTFLFFHFSLASSIEIGSSVPGTSRTQTFDL